MRFLFGIFVGAGLTLLLATAIDAPTSPVLEELRQVWQRVIAATGDTLFRHDPLETARRPSAGALATPTDTATRPPTAAPAPRPRAETAAASSSTATREAPPVEARPAPADGPATAGDAAAAAAPAEAAAPLASEEPVGTPASVSAAEPSLASTPSTPPAGPTPDAGPAPATSTTQAIWVPFHSERSARGFARRLSTQFDHPFSVERRGPGAYSVVFSYEDALERDLLLAGIAEITGQ